MNDFTIKDKIRLAADTTLSDGTEASVKLTFFDKNDNKLLIKEPKGIKVEKGQIKYPFTIEEIAKDKAKDVSYVKGWIDTDGDKERDYDEEVILNVKSNNRAGTLRIGVFFDGTGNDPYKEEEYSNIKKLFDLYPNQIDGEGNVNISNEELFPHTMSTYIRGVGSASRNGKSIIEGLAGGALAIGMTERIKGMLFYIQSAIKVYRNKKIDDEGLSYLPKTLEFDIFGFSRGAATARHFVNVLKQEGEFWSIKIDGKEIKYTPKETLIRTLNIFDTVGSVGTPGKDIDPGFTYHIDQRYIEDKIHHFIANDEYRYNFDSQLASTNDTDYPKNIQDGKIEEIVLLGSHSDLGGGYPNSSFHQITNNELSKYYLNRMYEKCKLENVPLKDVTFTVKENVKNSIVTFDEIYKQHQNLKIVHKKLREWQAHIGDKFTSNFNTDDLSFTFEDKKLDSRQKRAANFYSKLLSGKNLDFKKDIYLESLPFGKELLDIFGGNKEIVREFIIKSNSFHDKYIHISHDDSIAMGAQRDGNILHRDYFIPKKENMKKENKETEQLLENTKYNPGLSLGIVLARANKTYTKMIATKFEDY